MAPHPVRPPRAKKSSISSATEEEAQKPTRVHEKAPRRKKRNTEINPEDVLEARNRKYLSTTKDSEILSIKNENKRESMEIQNQLKEERMNNRNKIYGMQKANSEKVKELEKCGRQVEIIYDKGRDNIYGQKCNKYERLPLKTKNYDIVDSSKNNCYLEKNESAFNEDTSGTEEKMYEKNQGSYDFNQSASKSNEKISQKGDYKYIFIRLTITMVSLYV